ncbi:MAG: ornithine aminomutase subunit alpha [Spirochaetaceae bacterium]
MERTDDFAERRRHLADLREDELEARFWKLTEELVDPLLEHARTHTTPSIERSVLLRMGFSGLEAKEIVDKTIDHGLMGKGAGHAVYLLAQSRGLGIREAGLELAEGRLWDAVEDAFKQKKASGSKGGDIDAAR